MNGGLKYVRYPHCQKVLPLVYDDSLSYYESICKLVKKMNEIIDEVNSIDIDNILNRVDEEIDKELEDLYKQMDYLTNNVNSVMGNVNNALDLYHKQVLLELNNTTANLTSFVSTQLSTLKKYVDSEDDSIRSEIRYQIELLKKSIPDLTTVIVKSPYSGKLITIQEAINEIWNNLRVYALTAYEYDSLQLTANEYDSFMLTANEYDYYAKEIIYADPILYPFSPWTGERVFYQKILYRLVDYHRTNALTASEYDGKLLNATNYDGLDLSAYNYDWNAKTLITN